MGTGGSDAFGAETGFKSVGSFDGCRSEPLPGDHVARATTDVPKAFGWTIHTATVEDNKGSTQGDSSAASNKV